MGQSPVSAVLLRSTSWPSAEMREVLSMDSPGGKPGAYNVTATALRNRMWSASERVITGKITTATTAASLRRSEGKLEGVRAWNLPRKHTFKNEG
jgi:hypothetical protein